MLKSELVVRIADQNPHLYTRDVEKLVDAILNEIEAALVRRDRVEVRGFGVFLVKTWPARAGRNPKTRAKISVLETRHPAFRMSKEMHARLNGTPGSALRAASTSRDPR